SRPRNSHVCRSLRPFHVKTHGDDLAVGGLGSPRDQPCQSFARVLSVLFCSHSSPPTVSRRARPEASSQTRQRRPDRFNLHESSARTSIACCSDRLRFVTSIVGSLQQGR